MSSLSSTVTPSTATVDSSIYWCCLYAVERDGKFTLVYGYAVSAQEQPSQWGVSLVWDNATWKLNKINCFLRAECD